MRYKLSHPTGRILGKIAIPGSKSEANRLLILRHLYAPGAQLSYLSTSSDTAVLREALGMMETEAVLNAGEAGTAYRFLTALLAITPGSWRLAGSARMEERPIAPLVEALRALGASIRYLGKEGYPPLAIEGAQLQGGRVEVDGRLSSQYISALMMIGPSLPAGLSLHIPGFSVSTPYIYLTAHLMRRLGLTVHITGYQIEIPARPAAWDPPDQYVVEPDWSAASYWFAMACLASRAELFLPGFRQHSLQGDSFVANLFAPLGVEAHFIGAGFRLRPGGSPHPPREINLVHNPDLAQTLAVVYAARQWPVTIKGLQTLRHKETDRLAALRNELEKTGAQVEIGEDYLRLRRGCQSVAGCRFQTYGDHRMAMALAPLALLGPIEIENPEVVGKSYGRFWDDLRQVRFEVSAVAP